MRVGILDLGLHAILLASEVVSGINVLDALLEHVVDGVDGFLHILRAAFEEVADCGHAVLLLRVPYVVHLVDQLRHHHIVIIILLAEDLVGIAGLHGPWHQVVA